MTQPGRQPASTHSGVPLHLAALGAVAIAAAVLVALPAQRRTSEQIDLAARELRGLTAAQPAIEALTWLPAYQLTPAGSAARRQFRDSVSSALERLGRSDRSLDPDLLDPRHPTTALSADWAGPDSAGQNLQRRLLARLRHLADRSDLTLEPDRAGYYLMDLLMFALPAGQAALRDGGPQGPQTERLGDAVLGDLDLAGRTDRGTETVLPSAITAAGGRYRAALKLVAADTGHSGTSVGTLAQAADSLADAASLGLADILTARMESLRAERRQAAGIASLLALVGGLIGWSLWRTVQRRQDLAGSAVADLEAALAGARKELGETRKETLDAQRSKTAFLATMSHEIRTPLNGILGMADVLAEAVPPDQSRLVQQIQRAGRQLLQLLSNVLDMSRLESGRMVLEPAAIDPATIVAEVAELFAPLAAAREVRLVVDCRPSVPGRAIGDGPRFRQIAATLVDNAVKFTEHGVIRIQLDATVEGADLLCRLAVQDSGPGIAKDDFPNLFNRFTQADSGTNRRFGGAGLGLAIAQRLVELMNGAIEVTSTPGLGSTFTAHFEMAVDESWTPAPQETPFSGRRILVADGLPAARDAVVVTLTGAGATALGAASAAEAVTLIREAERAGQPFDLILADHAVPGGGSEAVRAAAGPGTRLVHLTFPGASATLPSLENPTRERIADYPLTRAATLAVVTRALAADSLPERRAEVPAAPPQGATMATNGAFRVLVVDDSELNGDLMGLMLADFGGTATHALSGAEALKLWEAGRYDLILMDLMMPEMDGPTTTETLRERERARGDRTPVVAWTANVSDADRTRCIRAGADDFLEKPFDRQELASLLDRFGLTSAV